MSDPLIDVSDAASTLLTPEERDGLVASWVTRRDELNAAEQVGVADADGWAFARRRDVLGDNFLRRLHERMLGDVWCWAGEFRRTNTNLGVDFWRIEPELRQLLGDVRAQIEHSAWPADEIAVRFKHRLVFIHPFPNGNGRLSRLAGDLLAVQLGQDPFTWGRGNLVGIGDLRRLYVEALRAADGGVIGPLLAFARS